MALEKFKLYYEEHKPRPPKILVKPKGNISKQFTFGVGGYIIKVSIKRGVQTKK